MVGTSISVEAVDLSVHGMQFRTDDQLYSGSQLNITIGIGEPFAMYLLRGEIRWVKTDGEHFFMGILLKQESTMDLDKWVANFDATFN